MPLCGPMLLSIGVGCTDYSLFDKNEEKNFDITPSLEVYPASVDAGVMCVTVLSKED